MLLSPLVPAHLYLYPSPRFFPSHNPFISASSRLFFPSRSGLNLAPVARLRSSWEKLPSKYEKLFGDLQDVFDPSRNMAKYRNILSSQSMQPPIIPLFPVVKKDLTFLHEGKKSLAFDITYHVATFPFNCLLTERLRPFLKLHVILYTLKWTVHTIQRK